MPEYYALGKVVISLVLIIFMIVGGLWVIKRSGLGRGFQTRQGPRLNVLKSLSMGARSKVSIVQIGPKTVALGVTPTQISFLCEVEPDDEYELDQEQSAASPSFMQVLRKQGIKNV